MPRKAQILTPAEAEARKEARRARVREGVARHKERLAQMTRLEQAAWKARESLGEDFQPYTPAEMEAAARLKGQIAALEAAATALNRQIQDRLASQIGENPRLASLLAELDSGAGVRIDLAPF